MMASGKMANLSKESVTTPMERSTMASGSMGNLTDVESRHGPMEESTMVYGNRGNLLDKERKYIPMAKQKLDTGKMELLLKVINFNSNIDKGGGGGTNAVSRNGIFGGNFSTQNRSGASPLVISFIN
jgi:hypothetical protein